MRAAPIMLAVLLGACQQAPADDRAPVAVAQPSQDLSAVTTLEGEWRVAGIDGQPLDEPYGLALSGSPNELWWNPRCAGMVHSYRIEGAAIEFGPRLDSGPPPPPGTPPPAICTIGLPPKLTEAVSALDAATEVGSTPSGGVLISGGGRSLLLFPQ